MRKRQKRWVCLRPEARRPLHQAVPRLDQAALNHGEARASLDRVERDPQAAPDLAVQAAVVGIDKTNGVTIALGQKGECDQIRSSNFASLVRVEQDAAPNGAESRFPIAASCYWRVKQAAPALRRLT